MKLRSTSLIFVASLIISAGLIGLPEAMFSRKKDTVQAVKKSSNILILADPIAQNGNGYELFHNNNRVGFEPNWTRTQGANNCAWNVEKYGKEMVKCRFNGRGLGYELFHNNKRVGFEPAWTRNKAADNCSWNVERYGKQKVRCRFDGRGLGYELFHNNKRVGFEPAWTRNKAINNCTWNVEQYGKRTVECQFDGRDLGID